MNRPRGFVGAGWFKLGHHGGPAGELPIVFCVSVSGRDIFDPLQQPVMVEPSQPFQGGQFDSFRSGLSRVIAEMSALVLPLLMIP